jgi:hypothetical protein
MWCFALATCFYLVARTPLRAEATPQAGHEVLDRETEESNFSSWTSAPLRAKLSEIGVHDSSGVGDALSSLGLHTLGDMALLDDHWATAELDAELKRGGRVSFGDRVKLRLRCVRGFAGRGEKDHSSGFRGSTRYVTAVSPQQGRTKSRIRRVQTEEVNVERAKNESTSTDTIALIVTVVIGLVGYLVQAHMARVVGLDERGRYCSSRSYYEL